MATVSITIGSGLPLKSLVTTGGSFATYYTVPANAYAIIQTALLIGGVSPEIAIYSPDGTQQLLKAGPAQLGDFENQEQIYLGAGWMIQASVTSGTCNMYINGVEFVN